MLGCVSGEPQALGCPVSATEPSSLTLRDSFSTPFKPALKQIFVAGDDKFLNAIFCDRIHVTSSCLNSRTLA